MTPVCSVPDCGRAPQGRGLCSKHYQRARYQARETAQSRGRVPNADEKHRLFCKVDGCTEPYDTKGFCKRHYQIDRRRPGETHNLIAPKGSGYLGRKLHHDESVHHKNGIRDDNRLENLELRTRFHGLGQSIDDTVAWAKEILNRYESDDD